MQKPNWAAIQGITGIYCAVVGTASWLFPANANQPWWQGAFRVNAPPLFSILLVLLGLVVAGPNLSGILRRKKDNAESAVSTLVPIALPEPIKVIYGAPYHGIDRGMRIESAMLGAPGREPRDVTLMVKKLAEQGESCFPVSWQLLLGEDPRPHAYKYLTMTISWTEMEGNTMWFPVLPKDSHAQKCESCEIQRKEIDALNRELEPYRAAATNRQDVARRLKDAPTFLANTNRDGTLVLTNDGASAALNISVGPLVHEEIHDIIPIYKAFGSIPAKASEERRVKVATDQRNSTAGLWDVMRRGAMDPDPLDAVTIDFEDSRGNRYSQRFILTSEIDGTVTWKPEQVQARDQFSALGAH